MPDYRYLLSEREIPKFWYNVVPDLPAPMSPPLHPGTLQPAGPQDLEAIFPHALIEQEVTAAQNIPIPEPVLDILRLWRPTPLHRALRLEKALGTPAKIFFKNEGVSPAGSHKPNTAIAQAYYNKAAGVKRLTTETGAGQWGSALVAGLQRVRHGVHGLHGEVQLLSEAPSPHHDGMLGREMRSFPQ